MSALPPGFHPPLALAAAKAVKAMPKPRGDAGRGNLGTKLDHLWIASRSRLCPQPTPGPWQRTCSLPRRPK